jgi:hypothetical protein
MLRKHRFYTQRAGSVQPTFMGISNISLNKHPSQRALQIESTNETLDVTTPTYQVIAASGKEVVQG